MSDEIQAATEQYLATLTPEQAATPVDFRPRNPENGQFVKVESDAAPEETPDSEPVAETPSAETPVPPPEEVAEESVAPVAEEPKEEEPKTEESKTESIVIPGLKERGEEDLEVPVEDPVLAERLRRLLNDGMRKAEYREKMQEVEQFKRERAEFEAELESNPVGVLMQYATPERQQEIARALLVEHWDTLVPVIQQFAQDPVQIARAQRDVFQQNQMAAQEATVRKEAARREAEILGALSGLVPDSVDAETRSAFLRDAERDLIDAAYAKQVVTAETVPMLVKRRMQMYGFVEKPQVKPLTVKRGDAPKPVSVDEAKKKQAAIQQKAKAVKATAALPPAGRGPVATRRPIVDASADVEQASTALRQMGTQSWADYR
jgi:hypothetical protein